jgi:hypothetical protein
MLVERGRDVLVESRLVGTCPVAAVKKDAQGAVRVYWVCPGGRVDTSDAARLHVHMVGASTCSADTYT